MIESKIKFYSPIYRKYQLDIATIIYLLILLFVIFLSGLNNLIIFGTSMVIINNIILNKIYDFYDILGDIKLQSLNFKKWLDFMKTNTYKNLIKLIYLYYFSAFICISGGFIYFLYNDSIFKKILGIIYMCSILIHLLITYIKFKKVKL